MATRPVSLLAAACLLSACAAEEGGDDVDDCAEGRCDEPPDQICADVRYNNGTCDPQLTCAVPDIDCFTTFATDEAGAAFYSQLETQIAMQEGHPPRALLPTSDPRFVKMRALLDRGWESFRANRPVGKLAEARPALVMIEDEEPNAFVVPDLATGNAAVVVMVQTGLLTLGNTDDATLGVTMHEFQHVVGLHVVGDTGERIRKFYAAPDGVEPIGKFASDDPLVRAKGEAWLFEATDVGAYAQAELGGLTISRRSSLDQMFQFVLAQGQQTNPTGCAAPVAAYGQLLGEIFATYDSISGELVIAPGTRTRIDSALAGLRDQCLQGITTSFSETVAPLFGTTAEELEASLDAEDRALVAGKHVVDAIAALAIDRRSQMRSIEDSFEPAAYRPWSAFRYFSFEEDADDVSVTVLRAAKLAPAGTGDFLLSVLPAEDNTRCAALIADGYVPAYGVDLTDNHHGTCWRVHHIRALADETAGAKYGRRYEPSGPGRPQRASRLRVPKRLRDVIMH